MSKLTEELFPHMMWLAHCSLSSEQFFGSQVVPEGCLVSLGCDPTSVVSMGREKHRKTENKSI